MLVIHHTREQAVYFHAWNQLVEIGPKRMQRLLEHFGSASRAWKATSKEFIRIEGFDHNLCQKIEQKKRCIDPEKKWEELAASGISILLYSAPGYPSALNDIYDPPMVLYYQGDRELLNTLSIAIVGSRRHTHYGRKSASRLASELVSRDVTVTSGMARGIDTWAHKGALEGKGKTIAVLGCGLDICYPPENKLLKETIQDQGLVISEFPPGTQPTPLNFPRRNRIISGLSLGTVVVEAAVKSGALITAEFALEQGKEVFAVPGSIESPYSRGCHKLIKEGAKLVEGVEDILEEFLSPFSGKASNRADLELDENGLQEQLSLDEDEISLLDVIQFEPVVLEEIAKKVKIPLSKINLLLLELELKGIVKQLPGNYYIRNKHGGV